MFGENVFSQLVSTINERAQYFNDAILAVGWDHLADCVTICEENSSGSSSHTLLGMVAIGSGAHAAISQMLLLGHTDNRRLEDTIYTVAAAKFAAESAEGVGKHTMMAVSWKRSDNEEDRHVYIQRKEMETLRTIWENHGRPKIPSVCYKELVALTKASRIPDTARSPAQAVSDARWENMIEGSTKPLRPGEKSRETNF